MKIIILLLLLNLSLFAVENRENGRYNSEVSKSTQTKQKKPAFINVSDVPQNAISVSMELKKTEERIREEKEKTEEMHAAIEPYVQSITDTI